MLTNPNTLGLFDEHLLQVTGLVHEAGGLVYGDGANLNAILGVCRPGKMGFDVMHYNLHKTFSTPHGGGGPGGCAVCAVDALAPYLPGPLVECLELQARLKDILPVPYGERHCMHEFVAQSKVEGAPDIRALHISKRLMDYGFHPPTNYFPGRFDLV